MLSGRGRALGTVAVVVASSWAAAASAATPTLTPACTPPQPGAMVAVFPIPGTRYNRPETQITFRDIRPDQIGSVTVRGSRSGLHRGRVLPDSDCGGGSFMPAKHFVEGETVTVSTRLNVLGGRDGHFSFKIAHTLPLGKRVALPVATPPEVMAFRSRPDLKPAAVSVIEDSRQASSDDIFVAPQNGPKQNGPMILDPHGRLVWFLPYAISDGLFFNDFRVQKLDLDGKVEPVLTWWQGFWNAGAGQNDGRGVIVDSAYQKIADVRAANGLDAGSHEFLVTPNGDAYVTAPSPVRLPDGRHVIDSVLQEIDMETGLVLFEWHALDHVSLHASYDAPLDPYHLNSISLAADGNLIISMRQTSAIYKVDHQTGHVLWTLGGKHSSFQMGPGTTPSVQHDVVSQPDGTITMFDDASGRPIVRRQSRGIRLRLDLQHMTVTLVRAYYHSPPLSVRVEGGMQVMPDGHVSIGWGSQPFFSEYTAAGRQVFDARFRDEIINYRAYRFPWTGQPTTLPDLAVSPNAHGSSTLYASWNGATDVSAWRVLAGSGPRTLGPLRVTPKKGFETAIHVASAAPYFAVQALGGAGQTLSTSLPIRTPSHIAPTVPDSRLGFDNLPSDFYFTQSPRTPIRLPFHPGPRPALQR